MQYLGFARKVVRVVRLRLPTQNIVVSLRCSLVILLVLGFLRPLYPPPAALGSVTSSLTAFGTRRRWCDPPIKTNKKAIHDKWMAFLLVEMTGFEPAASSSRTKRATKLRYISI